MWTEITRRKYEREGQRYASDLTNAEWALIEPQMPAAKRKLYDRRGYNPEKAASFFATY